MWPPMNPVRKRAFWLLFGWLPVGCFAVVILAALTSDWLSILVFPYALAVNRALDRITCPHCRERVFARGQTAGEWWNIVLTRETCAICGRKYSEHSS